MALTMYITKNRRIQGICCYFNQKYKAILVRKYFVVGAFVFDGGLDGN